MEQLAKDKWKGRFWGVWQHVPFDYTVEFGPNKSSKRSDEPTNPGEKHGQLTADTLGIAVAGKATIDGASYDWTGTLAPNEFDIQFTGSRYEGHLELARVRQPSCGEMIVGIIAGKQENPSFRNSRFSPQAFDSHQSFARRKSLPSFFAYDRQGFPSWARNAGPTRVKHRVSDEFHETWGPIANRGIGAERPGGSPSCHPACMQTYQVV